MSLNYPSAAQPHASPGAQNPRPWGAWALLAIGFLIYVGVQGYLTVSPLRHWTLVPEVDDGLTYVVKSQQMLECFNQDCPALNDLRDQLLSKPGDPPAASEAFKQRSLAFSRVFPVYHPLFSTILIGVSKLGLDGNLMEAYRVLWTLAPLIFGMAFASWLTVIFGPGVAGMALILLAFKIFPDTGLHHLVPSNLTMALAVVLWARIIARRGWAPWSLVLGSLVLVAMHLIGIIYAAMAGMLALFLADQRNRKRLLAVGGAAAASIVIFLLAERLSEGTAFVNPLLFFSGSQAFSRYLQGIAQNALRVMVDNVRLSEGLWGSPAVFCGAVTLGLGSLSQSTRKVVLRILLLYAIVLGGLMFYVSSHPADVLFRVWIPLVVLLFGLVAQAICYSMGLAAAWWRERRQSPPDERTLDLKRFWPLVVVAVLLGYSGQMISRGAEQVQAMAAYLRDKEPLALYRSQPKELLAQARPGDRVLYTSFILMDYYLINGGLRLGAVYYHPAFQNSRISSQWLTRPDLRFAVAFQPTMYHPSFEGKDESDWWVSSPELRYSPLNQRRGHAPLAREGKIPAALYRWLDIQATTKDFPKTLRLQIDNPRGETVMEMVPLSHEGKPLNQYRQALQIPARRSGWLTVDVTALPPGAPVRLIFPRDSDTFSLAGLTFGEDRLRWPWAQKALLTFHPRNDPAGPVTVSFDPAGLLPPELRGRRITVLDDRGSSVLLELGK